MTEVRDGADAPVVEFDIGGMTCASCAARIQRKVGRLPGVEAAVNLATNSATVTFSGNGTTPDDVIACVEGLGYTATPAVDLFAERPVEAEPGEADADSRVESAGDHHARRVADLRRRLTLAVPLSVVVVVIEMVPALHMHTWLLWVSVLLAAPVVWWSGWPLHESAVRGLRHGSLGMDTLVSLGSAVAYLWSIAQLLAGSTQVYAEVAAVVVTFVLMGRWLEARATRATSGALAALSALQVDQVTLVDREGNESVIPLSRLSVGDRFVVRPGERVATDGVVVGGTSTVDASHVTGEALPVDVSADSQIIGGSVNGSGRVVVAATSVGSDTVLARIAHLIKQAQQTKAPVERLVDRVAGVFVPVVLLIALATLVGWQVAGRGTSFAIGAAVAVLVVACPCALGLATPTALVAGTGRGAELGVLLRGPQVLEKAQAVTAVVLDKTGTVTTGRMTVDTIVGADAEQRFRIGSVEAASEHPIARAIASSLLGDRPPLDVQGFEALPGVGARGSIGSSVVEIRKADDSGLAQPELDAAVRSAAERGMTPVVAWEGGDPVAVIVVGDHPKPDSAAAVSRIRTLGLRPILLTGDREWTARAIAADVGIDEVLADVMPEDKVAAVSRLQATGTKVAMVGDGINDSAALAQADLGIAMGSGTDAAREAADLTVVRDQLGSVADAIELARRTWRTIKQNLFWAFAYNTAAIPLAVSGLLSPMIAGGAMALSSVLVVSNSLRLRRFRPSSKT